MINAKRAKIIAEKSKKKDKITIVYNYEQLSEHIRLEAERGRSVTNFMIPTGSLRPKTLEANGYNFLVMGTSNDSGEWNVFNGEDMVKDLNFSQIYLNFAIIRIWW